MSYAAKRTLIELGALEPNHGPHQPLVIRDVSAAKGVVVRQKAVQLAYERLEELSRSPATAGGPVDTLIEELSPVVERGRRRSEALKQAAEQVRRIVEETGARAYLMKGLAFRSWYDNPSHRDVGDIDIWTPDADHGWVLAAGLRAAGWTYQQNELPWLKRDLRSSKLYGQARMQAPTGGERFIDIHFGPFYSVGHCGVIPVEPPAEGSIVPATDNLAMMVGNAANDHFITVKDLNDLWLGLGRSDVDWDRLTALLREGGIAGFFGLMIRRLRGYLRLDEQRREVLASVPVRRIASPLSPSHTDWGWRRRWLSTSLHAGRVAARTPGLGVLRTTGGAFLYYARPLRLHVVDSVPDPVRLSRADNATCIRLIPADYAATIESSGPPPGSPEPGSTRVGDFTRITGSAELKIAATPHGDLARCRGDVFIPTVDYSLDRRLVEATRDGGPASHV